MPCARRLQSWLVPGILVRPKGMDRTKRWNSGKSTFHRSTAPSHAAHGPGRHLTKQSLREGRLAGCGDVLPNDFAAQRLCHLMRLMRSVVRDIAVTIEASPYQ